MPFYTTWKINRLYNGSLDICNSTKFLQFQDQGASTFAGIFELKTELTGNPFQTAGQCYVHVFWLNDACQNAIVCFLQLGQADNFPYNLVNVS